MIIGISGKIGSGKDTVGKIIQGLTAGHDKCLLLNGKPYIDAPTKEEFAKECLKGFHYPSETNWQIRKFAGKLKQCISIITGISIEDLEKEEVKNRELSNDWSTFICESNGHTLVHGDCSPILSFDECMKMHTEYCRTHLGADEDDFIFTAKKLTIRRLLQQLGTEVGRSIHPNFWVNALFSEYHCITSIDQCEGVCGKCTDERLPNWIITDMRFPNELKAVKDRGGITIRVVKINEGKLPNGKWITKDTPIHVSETALDNATFDYTISAKQGDIESLIQQVREILIKESLI